MAEYFRIEPKGGIILPFVCGDCGWSDFLERPPNEAHLEERGGNTYFVCKPATDLKCGCGGVLVYSKREGR